MTDNEPGLVEVTQADRDAAAAFSEAVVGKTNGRDQIAECRAGTQDASFLVQAFARHRLSSIQPLTEQLAERDATIARLREALRPFAREAEGHDTFGPDAWGDDEWLAEDAHERLTVGDVRRARAALAEREG